ncbi:MAG: hypothetical protein WDM77_19605 [Steroidobacteraceae bacterium]
MVIQVPAYVAFQMSILDATGKRITPIHDSWLQVTPGETVHCNGCHTPAAQQRPVVGQTAHSHGRAGVFAAAYAGGNASIPFTNSVASYTTNTGTTQPLIPTQTGQTMAETLSAPAVPGTRRTVCRTRPASTWFTRDIWTNPSAAAVGHPSRCPTMRR